MFPQRIGVLGPGRALARLIAAGAVATVPRLHLPHVQNRCQMRSLKGFQKGLFQLSIQLKLRL